MLPNVERLQDYVWRRHLAGAAGRLLDEEAGTSTPTAVGFVDIVGYTGRSRSLTDRELVDWVEGFEARLTADVVDAGGRIIKTIGDEVLFVTDTPTAAVEVALRATERGADPGDPFPPVRGGLAYGEVVSRLGDVLGPTVNVAARLTSLARPSTVLVDRGAYDALHGMAGAEEPAEISPYSSAGGLRFRRLPRTSVKGYSSLEAFAVRRER